MKIRDILSYILEYRLTKLYLICSCSSVFAVLPNVSNYAYINLVSEQLIYTT